MNKYLFILGNHPELSIAEVKSLFLFLGIEVSFLSLSARVLQVNTDYKIENNFIDKLGGTIKITSLLSEQNKISFKDISELIIAKEKTRTIFGVSVYGMDYKKRDFINLCQDVKDEISKYDIKSNYIFPQVGAELSSVVAAKKIVRKEGIEINIIKNQDKYYFAETIQIQDFQKYSQLDYGIPCPDPKTGMLPPKLAQMMINLSLPELSVKSMSEKSVVFYDPFCGRGRIILQTLDLGFGNIFGSDIDIKAVEDTRKNVAWLLTKTKNNLAVDFSPKNIFVHDASKNFNLPEKSIKAIVTEPYIGPAYRQKPTFPEIEKLFSDLEKLYLQSFENFAKILAPESKIVFIFPTINGQSLLSKLVDKISSLGYYKVASFLYSRSYQIVKREICVFKFQNQNVKFPINVK